MHSTAIPLYTPTPTITRTNGIHRKPNLHFGTSSSSSSGETQKTTSIFTCKAASNSSYSSITDIIGLYELLGVDSSCNQAGIKMAYRALQKRCHPDIVGPVGHDMAIILNEAYAVLSDPNSRLAYDKEQAKVEDLQGYTGKPIYSVWLGSENEDRSVFVDEVKCVGCLKCALLAEKTFAVESCYGRARVVAQWADPEEKIIAAIEACPVDCISIVQRSNLAALEFLMSKKPRGSVRIGAGKAIGPRASDVFDDLEKFQARYSVTQANSKESDIQWKAWMSAIQRIRSVSNWLYWQTPSAEVTDQNLSSFKGKPILDPDLERLKKVSEARKQAIEGIHSHKWQPSNFLLNDEYWEPLNHVLPESHIIDSGSNTVPRSSPTKVTQVFKRDFSSSTKKQINPFLRFSPTALAAAAAFTVRLHQGEGAAGDLEVHIAGSLVRDIVNSSWLQVILAGVTWYLIGSFVVGVVRAVQLRVGKDE